MPTSFPPPEHFPSYRGPSGKSAPGFRDLQSRSKAAQAFHAGAQAYHQVRPSYPTEVTELFSACAVVADVGAGTGILSEQLAQLGTAPAVLACDPSPDMTRVLHGRLPGIPVWRATAEATALADASLDAVACAQAWHWVDVGQACAELDRILRPHGFAVLVWNTIDVAHDPWILRLTRIMHSGDVHRPGFLPELSAPFIVAQELRTTWAQELTPEQLHLLMHTRSYWLRSDEKIHQRMTHNLDWYLYEHMGFKPGQKLTIPYRTDAFVVRRGK